MCELCGFIITFQLCSSETPHPLAQNKAQSRILQMFYAALLLTLLQFHQAIAQQTIQDIGQLFRSTQVVPDVIPAFNPSVHLGVSFDKIIIPGQNLTRNGIDLPSIILIDL